MKRKLATKEISFLLLVLAFILSVGIIATKKYNPTKQISEVIQETESEVEEEILYDVPSERPESVPEDWMLYTNNKVGFSFYYPPEWEVTNKTFEHFSMIKHGYSGREIYVYVEKSQNLELEEFIDKQVRQNKSKEGVKIGNRSGLQVKDPLFGVPYLSYLELGNNIVVVGVLAGGEISAVDPNLPQVKSDIRDYFQILESFQFASN